MKWILPIGLYAVAYSLMDLEAWKELTICMLASVATLSGVFANEFD
ncbi:hypothetical protein bcere0016_12120 [Bacillus cereus 95/8201]|nr:hypothetical protein bcere0016_12120 [Bacillus cereus 95/8201]